LLIKNPQQGFVDPIDADELAGLACDSDMEARLVTRTQADSWQLSHGPFATDRFAGLGETNWTLLVQAVDQVHEGVEALKRYFDFLPAWRIDDVMVSYACDGGGVGPHFDQYDVFLIQGRGSRRWKLGQHC
jgi:50S ribosomal protein L16 3-hydroxylase